MRLIDAYKVRCDRDDYDTYADYIKTFDAINDAPTIDAVPVVRCKDCKHYADDACNRYADETLGYVHSTQADGFCWVAERKGE